MQFSQTLIALAAFLPVIVLGACPEGIKPLNAYFDDKDVYLSVVKHDEKDENDKKSFIRLCPSAGCKPEVPWLDLRTLVNNKDGKISVSLVRPLTWNARLIVLLNSGGRSTLHEKTTSTLLTNLQGRPASFESGFEMCSTGRCLGRKERGNIQKD